MAKDEFEKKKSQQEDYNSEGSIKLSTNLGGNPNIYDLESVKDKKGIELLSDADKEAKKYNLYYIQNIIDILFDTLDSKEAYQKLYEKGYNISFVIYCIKYCASIRFNQYKHFINILEHFGKSESIQSDFIFSEYSIEETIKNDDYENFIKLAKDPKFISNKPIEVNLNDNKIQITYIQLICFFGSIKCFKAFISLFTSDFKDVSKYAIAGGNKEIIDLLEQKGVNFDNNFEVSVKYHRYEISDWLLLNYKCEPFELSKSVEYLNIRAFFFLLSNKICNSPSSINAALHESIKIGNIDLVKILIDECHADIKDKIEEKKGKTRIKRNALQAATEKDNIEIFKYLIEECHANAEEKTEEKDENGNDCSRTLYHIATEKGDIEIVKYLFEKCNLDANIRIHDITGNTTLQCACEKENIELVKYFVEECHVNVEEKDNTESNALHIACQKGNFEIVKYLVEECNMNVEEKNLTEMNALHIACYAHNYELVKFLVEKCHLNVEEKEYSGKTAFLLACENSDINIVKYLVEEGHANTNERITANAWAETALQLASLSGNLAIVKYLVENCNADVEEKTKKFFGVKRTALYFACESGNIDVIKYLVEECNASSDYLGEKILSNPIKNNNIEIVKYLVEKCHVNVDEIFNYRSGETALLLASSLGNYEIVKYLVEYCHADLKNINKRALCIACENSDIEYVRFLVEKCHMNVEDVIEERNKHGMIINKGKALYYASESGSYDIVKYLVEDCYADLKGISKNALCIACKQGDIDYVKYLVEKCHTNIQNEDINMTTEGIKKYIKEKCLLHEACEKCDLVALKKLIEEDNYFVDQKYNNRTPLFIASEKGDFELIKYLIENCNADKKSISKIALHKAIEKSDLECLKYLVEKCHLNIEEKDESGKTPFDFACYKSNLCIVRYLKEECHANVLAKEFSQSHINIISIINSVLEINEKTEGKVLFNIKLLIKEEDNSTYIKNFMEYAINIRPCKKRLISDLLIKLGFWRENKSHINIFSSKDYEEFIIKDDYTTFKRIIQKKTFNPQEKFFVHKSDPIFNVNSDRHVTYLQHIVFYGALKCFNYAIDQDCFDKSNISKYAVAGGNLEIIHKLKERGINFDNCFKVAVKFHQNILWENELSEYKMDKVYLSETQKFFNDYAFLYIYNHNKTIKQSEITQAKIAALKEGNLEMIKYLNVSIDEKYYGKSPFHIATKYHHMDVIKYFLEVDKSFFNEPDYENKTPLHIAANECYLDLVNFFYKECNAKIENINEEAIINAVKNGSYEFIDHLLFTWKVKNSQVFDISLFSIAASRGDIDIFNLIIKYFGNEFDKYQINQALKIAAENSNLDIIKCLVENFDADQTKISSNSLHVAAKKGDTEAVKYLIGKCKCKLTNDIYGRNLLMIATDYYSNDNYMSLIEYLVEECHMNVNEKGFGKRTVLHIATEKTNFKLVKYYVEECHAKIEVEDWDHITPLDIAKSKGNYDLISYFTDAIESSNKTNTVHNKVFDAIEEGDFELLQMYLEENEELLHPKYLIAAAEKENLDIIKYLIENCNIDVETEDSFGRTPLYISAEKGNLNNVKYLIEEQKADFEIECISRKTPLHIAAENGFIEVVKYLSEKCKSFKLRRDKNYQTPLSLALESHRPNISVINYFSSRFTYIDFYERNLLHIAAAKNDKKYIELIKDKFNYYLEEKDYRGKTPICYAIEKGCTEQVKYLINECKSDTSLLKNDDLINAVNSNDINLVDIVFKESKNAEISAKDEFGQTPLIIASQRSNLDMIKYLIEIQHANIEDEDHNNNNPLLIAAKNCNLSIFNYLIEEYKRTGKISKYNKTDSEDVYAQYTNMAVEYINKNLSLSNLIEDEIESDNLPLIKFLFGKCHMDANKKYSKERTALHIACEKGNFDIIKYLIEDCNANFDEKDSNERTVLNIASEKGNFDIIKYLIEECNANPETISDKALFYASEEGNLELIKYLVEECHMNSETISKMSLHIACYMNDFNLVKYLVEKCNANVEERDKKGRSPLHIACKQGNMHIVKYLVKECHAAANKKDGKGRTTVYIASEKGYINLVKYLVEECQINIEEFDYNGKSALHVVCHKGNFTIVKYFIEKCHANITEIDKQRRAPLHFACEKGNLEIVKYLVEECHVDLKKQIVLQFACWSGNFDLVKYLVEKCHADVEEKANDWNGRTPLHCACIKGNYNIVKYLVEECHVNIEETDQHKYTALHFAGQSGDLETFKYLVDECHLNIDEENDDGEKALHFACQDGNLDIVKYLVEECHADAHEKDYHKRTTLHYACYTKNIELVKYLVEKCHINTEEKETSFQRTALLIAIWKSSFEVVKYLIEEGHANIYEKDYQGNTALHIATGDESCEKLKYLIEECHLNIEEKDEKGNTILVIEYKNGSTELVNYLIDKCHANVEEIENYKKEEEEKEKRKKENQKCQIF